MEKRLCILNNGKKNSDLLLSLLGERLAKENPVT
jgi:hypothetical protein